MFQNIEITTKALDGLLLRHSTISNNIANVDTPGYKRMDVNFEQVFSKELSKSQLEKTNISNLTPKVYTDKANYSYRMDGNNVDVDVEMSYLTKTKLKYDVLAQRVSSQLGRYKTILNQLK
jgi:flagellar basal-body rod protein FlgB